MFYDVLRYLIKMAPCEAIPKQQLMQNSILKESHSRVLVASLDLYKLYSG